jgi:GNAT superfamily N-acetyltransferase
MRPEDVEALVASERWEPAGILFLFDHGGRIVGIIRAGGASTGRGYLHEIRLEPASRGRGLGMVLLAAALRYLESVGVTRAELDTTGENTPAHSIALKAGFGVARHWLHFLKPLHNVGQQHLPSDGEST